MRLATVNDPIQSSGLGAGNNFSIAASAKAFEILSSNLYQNKILAVIREVSCNAADAHKMVGKDFDSIRIHLPTVGEPWFSVRDYGPGLHHNDVMQLYTTYFSSTKDQSDDLIGGFGLGSKSPFSVADQFTVTSIHNGIRSDYVMYKDAGLPRVNAVRQQRTDEPNGLTVQVAVARDFQTWVNEACNFFKYWPTRPTFTPAVTIPTNPFAEPSIASDTLVDGLPAWSVGNGRSAAVFMGLVSYSLSLNAIPNIPTEVHAFLANTNPQLVFKVGEIAINPSRETLSYDAATCATLIRRFNEMHTAFVKQIQTSIDQQPTLHDARWFVFRTNANLSLPKNLTWRGVPLRQQITLDLSVVDGSTPLTVAANYITYRRKSWGSPTRRWQKRYGWQVGFDDFVNRYRSKPDATIPETIWFPTITAKTYRIVQHYYDEILKVSGSRDVRIIQGGNYAEIAKYFEEQGAGPVIDASGWPDPPKNVASIAPRNKPAKGYTFKPASVSWERDENDINMKGGGLAVEMFDGRMAVPKGPLAVALVQKWVAPTRIVGFRRAKMQAKNFSTTLKAANWEVYGPTWWQDNISEAVLEEAGRRAMLLQTLDVAKLRNVWQGFLQTFIGQSNIACNIFKTFQADLTSLQPDPCHWGPFAWGTDHTIAAWNSAEQTAAIKRGENAGRLIYKNFVAFLDANPMLRHVDWSYGKIDNAPLLDYLNR